MAVTKALDSSPPEQIAAVAGGQADGEVSHVICLLSKFPSCAL